MPNWCQNRVRIQGTPEQIRAVREHMSCEHPLKTMAWFDLSDFQKKFEYDNDYDKFVEARHNAEPIPFSLNSIVPQPENIFKGNIGEKERAQCRLEGRPNWYDWNCANWGTKWDVDAEISEISDSEIEISFDSAWAPPIKVIEALADHFPDLEITYVYAELGCMFAGYHVFVDGEEAISRRDDVEVLECKDDDEWKIIGPEYILEGFGVYA